MKKYKTSVVFAVSALFGLTGCIQNLTNETFNEWQRFGDGAREGVAFEQQSHPIIDRHSDPFINYYTGTRYVEFQAINTTSSPRCVRFYPADGGLVNAEFEGRYKDYAVINAGQTANLGSVSPQRRSERWQYNLAYNAKPTTGNPADPCKEKPSYSNDSGYEECYITTAVCRHTGKVDDCSELQTLRWYRDHVLAGSEQGKRDIERYYQVAPQIVAAIDGGDDPDAVYAQLRTSHILPSVAAVRQGDYARAYGLYREMTLELESRYLGGMQLPVEAPAF